MLCVLSLRCPGLRSMTVHSARPNAVALEDNKLRALKSLEWLTERLFRYSDSTKEILVGMPSPNQNYCYCHCLLAWEAKEKAWKSGWHIHVCKAFYSTHSQSASYTESKSQIKTIHTERTCRHEAQIHIVYKNCLNHCTSVFYVDAFGLFFIFTS